MGDWVIPLRLHRTVWLFFVVLVFVGTAGARIEKMQGRDEREGEG